MWARVTSIGLKGMDDYRVSVEVGTYVGNDSFKIVGLPDAAAKESKERIIAALGSLGYMLHGNKIIINLSPADHHSWTKKVVLFHVEKTERHTYSNAQK